MTIKNYCEVDGTDISAYVRGGRVRPVQQKRKIKSDPIIGTRKVALYDEGRDGYI